MSHHESVDEKAVRLLREGRVSPDRPDLAGDAQIFTVVGDTETYWPVVVTSTRQFCPCRAHTECSHLKAVVEWIRAQDARFTEAMSPTRAARYEAALVRRRSAESAANNATLDRVIAAQARGEE